jgi:hypothetical protein
MIELDRDRELEALEAGIAPGCPATRPASS